VALLRVLRAEFDAVKVRKVFHQLLAAGKPLAKLVWQTLTQPPPGPMSRPADEPQREGKR
jgi:hypothetical protein